MRFWHVLLLDKVRSSYWFATSAVVLGAVILVILIQYIDGLMDVSQFWLLGWMDNIGPDGARAVLSTIAGSTITVTGVIFSITIVALTMASSQFGPRLLSSFMKSGYTQWALGTFIGCFIYCLLVLVRIPEASSGIPVPYLSVLIGVALGIFSFMVLIYYIHHTATMMRAPVIIETVGNEAIATFQRVFPCSDDTGNLDSEQSAEFSGDTTNYKTSVVIRAVNGGYIQTLEIKTLIEIAQEFDGLIEMDVRPGQHLIPNQQIAYVFCDRIIDTDELSQDVLGTLVLGAERTSAQDAEFALDQLVEIAVRSLSPGINDPFTAIQCIDRIEIILATLSERTLNHPIQCDDLGTPRVLLKILTYEGIVNTAFNAIRQNSLNQPPVLIRLIDVIGSLVELTTDYDMREALLNQAWLIYDCAVNRFVSDSDRQEFEQRCVYFGIISPDEALTPPEKLTADII
ncbi:MAG: hypothetical protein DHS20C01_09070 [marine bacterium B5-7]|nr:MAG: hypothetical protein DHS20C01_09070 [marine bacterium B5-7]